MTEPEWVLDTFSCAGASAVGYHQAGYRTAGVELDPKRAIHYPYPVHVGDALEAILTLNQGGKIGFVLPEGRKPIKVRGAVVGIHGTVIWLSKDDFVAGHGSPPCQGYSRGNAGKITDWPKLIPDVRWVAGAYGGARRDKYEAKYVRHGGYVPPNKDVVKALMGIPADHLMTWEEVFESIPPAYTQHVGAMLRSHLETT